MNANKNNFTIANYYLPGKSQICQLAVVVEPIYGSDISKITIQLMH